MFQVEQCEEHQDTILVSSKECQVLGLVEAFGRQIWGGGHEESLLFAHRFVPAKGRMLLLLRGKIFIPRLSGLRNQTGPKT
jgi:hypothetical protein